MSGGLGSYHSRSEVAATGSIWTPASNPKIVAWWSPDRDITLSGSEVTAVADSSTSGADTPAVRSGTGPLLTLESNGLHSFDFNNEARLLWANATSSLQWTESGAYAFWVKLNVTSGMDRVLLKHWGGASATNRLQWRVIAGTSVEIWQIGDGVGGAPEIFKNYIDDTLWHHIVLKFVHDGASNATRALIYKDGVAVTGLSFNGTVPSAMVASTSALTFGGASGTFNGKFGNVCVVQGDLTEPEILQLYNFEPMA